jgi:hypothetical protein
MLRVLPEQLELESAEGESRPEASRRQHGTRRASSRSGGRATPPRSSTRRRTAADLLATEGALLTRSHLRELGLERRAVDAIFRALPVVALPGYSRPMIRAEQYLALVEQHTYHDDRVRPAHAKRLD